MRKFKLGDKVKFIKRVRKRVKKINSDYKYSDRITSHEEINLLVEQEGIVVGVRVLPNGRTYFEDVNDSEYNFTPSMVPFFENKSSTIVYLVATNLTRNPTKVSKEHLEEYNL